MKIVAGKRVRGQIDAAQAWWFLHRGRKPNTRRLVLPTTHYEPYYRVEKQQIRILAMWHSSRGTKPRV